MGAIYVNTLELMPMSRGIMALEIVIVILPRPLPKCFSHANSNHPWLYRLTCSLDISSVDTPSIMGDSFLALPFPFPFPLPLPFFPLPLG